MTLGREQFRIAARGRITVLDGAMGTLLHGQGLAPGRPPDELNLTAPAAVRAAHEAYVRAGARVILTNTFGASRPRLAPYRLGGKVGAINRAAVALAREAAGEGVWVAGDIGPLGEYVAPVGPLPFEDAYRAFYEQARVLAAAGVDLIFVETMADLREAKAAVTAARAAFDGPVVATMTFEPSGRTITGTPAAVAAAVLVAAGADAVGVNCSFGPEGLPAVIRECAAAVDAPLVAKPNAGLPRLTGGRAVFRQTPERFAAHFPKLIAAGASLVGGCCGTTPEHIRALAGAVANARPGPRTRLYRSTLASRTRLVAVGGGVPVVIGERLNPSGRPELAHALARRQYDLLGREARAQLDAGAAAVDVNVGGVPDAPRAMAEAVTAVQLAADAPVAADSPQAEVLAAGLAAAVGKPLLNSCPATPRAMATLLPLARRWGAAVIGLPLDRRGIPPTAAGRLALIEKFIDRALNAGIALDDIYVDPLMLTAAQRSPAVTFETLRGVREAFGVRTVLGVSNVSHGLPRRDILNEAAFLYAVGAGLDVALVNPLDPRMAEAMAAAGVLTGGLDAATYARRQAPPRRAKAPARGKRATPAGGLYDAVVEGRREEAAAAAAKALKDGADPLALNRRGVAAALEEVGRRFERREFFLPQVIRAAEAAHAAFAVILRALPRATGRTAGRVILATVAGDVHDIGKNVVGAVLRSHGFDVRDLGKSVPPARLVAATRRFGADVVGLSALMTTTMPEMEKAAAALRAAGVKAKILVGGAVVTPAYAKRIGAAYAPDAVAAARVARRLVKR